MKPINYPGVLKGACLNCGIENEASMHGGDRIFSFYCKKASALDKCIEPCTLQDWDKCFFNKCHVLGAGNG